MKKILLLIVMLLFFIGCSNTPTLNNNDPRVLAAKTFKQPTNDKAGIYIYRPDKFFGSALRREVYLDGLLLGVPAPGTFFYVLVDPNKSHYVETESEFERESCSVVIEPGENAYIEQYMHMGVFVGRTGVRQVPQGQAISEILNGKMLESDF